MGNWTALAFDDVSHASLERELARRGMPWARCAHIPATSSLAKAIRPTGANALAIAPFIDVVVMDGLPANQSIAVSKFPAHGLFLAAHARNNLSDYADEVKKWQGEVRGHRIKSSIARQQILREFLAASRCSPETRRVMVESRLDFLKTIEGLIAAGVEPSALSPRPGLPELATAAWATLEKSSPGMNAMRNDLWMDLDEFELGQSPQAKSLRKRLLAALDQVFGTAEGNRTVVYHGFHFFTAPQWALFQLLKRVPEVDQVFVVHDDGQSSVYEVWRRFFVDKWDMPAPGRVTTGSVRGAGLAAFDGALRGEKIDAATLSARLQVTSYRTPIEFVRHWKEDRSAAQRGTPPSTPRTFAPGHEDIARYIERFLGVSQVGRVNLGLLPVGAYLFALHGCIRAGAKGTIAFILSAEAIADIVGSGFLVDVVGRPVERDFVGVLRRVAPFFSDRRDSRDWLTRAQDLQKLVIAEVNPLGPRKDGVDDMSRIATAIGNPFRFAPWCDITVEEAKQVVTVIESIIAALNQIAASPKVDLSTYVDYLQENLLRGMQQVDPGTRSRIEATIRGIRLGFNANVDADSLGDVAALLLGGTSDFSDSDDDEEDRIVGEMRSLDEFGFRRSVADLHLTNLADGKYPRRATAYGWPYISEDIGSAATVDPRAMEIMETRAATSALSDMYLFSLALDGVADGRRVRLSYIIEEAGEETSPSPMLALLTVPSRDDSAAILARAGGLAIERAGAINRGLAPVTAVTPAKPSASRSELVTAAGAVDAGAAASSIACPRRFAIQWALGPSAAFTADHHHSFLYGNVLGVLEKDAKWAQARARRTVDDLWQHLTKGQRKSSEVKRVIKKGPSARPSWLFTLGGSFPSPKNPADGPISRAYQAATNGSPGQPKVIAPADQVFLPPAHGETDKKNKVCNDCPVKSRCAVWFDPTDLD